MRTANLLALAAAIGLAGCTVGPNYVRPTTDAPTAWRIDYPKAAEVANTKWWEQFDDPVLNDLVETALKDNRDVRIAAARIDQFLGALTSTRDHREGEERLPDDVAERLEAPDALPDALEPSVRADCSERKSPFLGHRARRRRVARSRFALKNVARNLIEGRRSPPRRGRGRAPSISMPT